MFVLGCFEKLRKATIIFVMSVFPLGYPSVSPSVRPSVCPHAPLRLPLIGFSLNLVFEYFQKNLSRKLRLYLDLTRITGTLHEDQYIQGVSGEILNILGSGIMDYSE